MLLLLVFQQMRFALQRQPDALNTGRQQSDKHTQTDACAGRELDHGGVRFEELAWRECAKMLPDGDGHAGPLRGGMVVSSLQLARRGRLMLRAGCDVVYLASDETASEWRRLTRTAHCRGPSLADLVNKATVLQRAHEVTSTAHKVSRALVEV